MPSIWEFLPAELRERLEASPRPGVVLAGYLGIDTRGCEAREANQLAWGKHEEARAAVFDWIGAELLSGRVVARGFVAGGAALDDRPKEIPPARWHGLRYDARRNAAVSLASGAVVAEGLDFERAAEPCGAAACDPVAVADAFVASGVYPPRAGFRSACPGAKAEAVERAWTIKIKPFRSGSHGRKSAETGRNGKALPAS